MTLRSILLLSLILFPLAAAGSPQEPGPAPAHDFIMARLAANEGDFDKALRLIDRVLRTDPQNPVLLFERASILVDAQKFPRAESELRRLLERDPDFYDANRLLGRLVLDRSNGSPSRIEEALAYLKAAYRVAPDDLATGLTVAQIYIATERYEEAAPILATVVERAPDNRPANYTYSQVLTRLGRTEEAQIYLERATAADPTFAPAVFQLIDAYQKEREWLKAAELLQPLLEEDPGNRDLYRQQAFFYLRAGKPAEARRILDELLAEDPRDERSKFFLAEALAELDELDRAETIYQSLLEHDPYNVDFLISLGLTRMARADYDGASETFQVLIGVEAASEPAKRLARTQLAAIEHHRGDYDASLAGALEVVSGGERLNQQAINIALEVYRKTERWSEAISLLDRMLSEYGQERFLIARKLEFLLYAGERSQAETLAAEIRSSEGGTQTVAEVYAQAKEYSGAIEILEELQKEKPDDVLTLFQLGAVLERAGRLEDSERTFERVLRLEPGHAPTLNYLGYMWADRGIHLDRAATMIEKAVELEPRNGAYLDSLGWAYFKLGKLDLAEKYLQQAATIVPDDPTIQEHLGDLAAKLGRPEAALDHYRSALGLDPEPKEEEAIRVKIAELEKR